MIRLTPLQALRLAAQLYLLNKAGGYSDVQLRQGTTTSNGSATDIEVWTKVNKYPPAKLRVRISAKGIINKWGF